MDTHTQNDEKPSGKLTMLIRFASPKIPKCHGNAYQNSEVILMSICWSLGRCQVPDFDGALPDIAMSSLEARWDWPWMDLAQNWTRTWKAHAAHRVAMHGKRLLHQYAALSDGQIHFVIHFMIDSQLTDVNRCQQIVIHSLQ